MTSSLVLYFSLVVARVGAFVAALPLFGSQTVPRLVKAGLVLALSFLWFGAIFTRLPANPLLEKPVEAPWLVLGVALLREAFLGALLGFAFGLFLAPLRVAGEYITQEMGLSFGNLISPTGAAPTGPLTQIFEVIGILIFFGLDGYHVFLAVLHSTFLQYPLGGTLPQVPVLYLVDGVAAAEEWGLLVAAPVGCCLFLTTIVLALLMRVAPQLNLYTIGFPLRLLVGLGATMLLLPNLVAVVVGYLGRYGEWLLQLLQ